MLGLNRLLGQLVGFAILVTFWRSRLTVDSTADIEVAAFRGTNLGGAGVVLIALLVAAWALRRDRKASVPDR